MADAQLLNWVVQGGSFALVVCVMIYLGRVLIPRTIEAFERQTAKFDAMVERIEARHAAELDKRDDQFQSLAETVRSGLEKVADDLARVGETVARLEARTDEHRPLAPDDHPADRPQRKTPR